MRQSAREPSFARETIMRWVAPVLLVLLAVSLSLPTIANHFSYDDHEVVVGSDPIREWHIERLWQLSWRPLRTLTLMVDYHLFGDHAIGYHVHNVAWHVIAVLLLYALVVRVTRSQSTALVAGVWFAVLPTNVEAVASIANRKELLCAAFSLAACHAYLQFVERRRWPWLGAAVLLWLLAVYAKEVALVAPFAIVPLEAWAMPRERRLVLKRARLALGLGLAGALLIAGYVMHRFDAAPWSELKTFRGFAGEPTFGAVLATVPRAFWHHMQLLVVPVGLSPDHLMKLSRSLLEPSVLLSSLGVLAVIVSMVAMARRAPIAAFGLAWLLIHYLPVSNLVPASYLVAERYLYLPAMGWCVCVASVITPWMPRSRLVMAAALVITSTYAARTVTYASTWMDERALWQYTLTQNPRSFRAHNNLGVFHSEHGEQARAIAEFDAALALNPSALKPLHNRAVARAAAGDQRGALCDLDAVISAAPGDADAFTTRGNVHYQLGESELAERDWQHAIELDRRCAEAHFNLGLLAAERGDATRAHGFFTRAARLGLKQARELLERRAGALQRDR